MIRNCKGAWKASVNWTGHQILLPRVIIEVSTVASCAITLESQLYYKGSQYALYASIILGYGYMCGVIQGKPKFLDINWSVLDISHIKLPVFTVVRVCNEGLYKDVL